MSKKEFVYGGLLLLVVALLVAGSRWSRLHDSQAISSDSPVHLYLEETTQLPQLNKMLVDSGLVSSEEEFQWAADLLGWRNFQKGHYLVDQGFTYDEFLSKLARGIQDPVSVTILPGQSKARIAQSVSKSMQFDSLAFHQTLNDSSYLSEHDLQEEDVIGRLYPNTYSVFWTSSPQSFLKRILSEFNKTVIQKYQDRFAEVDQSIGEVLTLASIVEWEAQSEEEEAMISGLYFNRLDRGMRLQADPTVRYAIGEGRRLLYEDYKLDHPYNTYRYSGLPPGPITNPSLSAIEATLYPEEHDYLYMVASPEGSHAFSKTFDEHKQKSAKWRQWIREQYRIKEQRENEENSDSYN